MNAFNEEPKILRNLTSSLIRGSLKVDTLDALLPPLPWWTTTIEAFLFTKTKLKWSTETYDKDQKVNSRNATLTNKEPNINARSRAGRSHAFDNKRKNKTTKEMNNTVCTSKTLFFSHVSSFQPLGVLTYIEIACVKVFSK